MGNPFMAEDGSPRRALDPHEIEADAREQAAQERDSHEGADASGTGDQPRDPESAPSSAARRGGDHREREASAPEDGQGGADGAGRQAADIDRLFSGDDAEDVWLPDPEGRVDRAGKPQQVANYRVLEVTSPLTVVDGQGQVQHIEPGPGGEGGRRFVVRSPAGEVQAMDDKALARAKQEGEQIIERNGAAAQTVPAGFFAMLMGVMVDGYYQRRSAKMAERNAQSLEQASEDSAAHLREWLERQTRDDIAAARAAMDAADEQYDQLRNDGRVAGEMAALERARENSTGTPEDYTAIDNAKRAVERGIREHPDLVERVQWMQQAAQSSGDYVDAVFNRYDKHPQIADTLLSHRGDLPNERDFMRIAARIGDVTRDGEGRGSGEPDADGNTDDQKRLKRLREISERIAKQIQKLMQRVLGQRATVQGEPEQ